MSRLLGSLLNFKAAMDWTNSMIGGHTTDDVRFWVDVMAIYPGDDLALEAESTPRE